MDGLTIDAMSVRYDDDARKGRDQGPPAVDGLSLEVRRGEVVALLGPSGCGKSSVLRAIAGLEPLAGGAVAWDGQDLAGVPVHRRGFGLMFQDGQLFPHRDVVGNVEFGLRMARLPRAERRARVAGLLDLVGLAGYGARSVATLSGGERQRVALARSLAPQPRLLLLDEPLSALDRALRERLADDLRAALVATGTTALFVTHDHDEAATVGDRVAVMSAGRLLQAATPADLWRRPATREVAEFLGYEAFVPLDSPLGARVRASLGGDVPAGARLAALAEGALVVLPGDSLAEAGALARGVVLSSAFRRGRTELGVRVEGIGRVTAAARPGVSAAPGDDVALGVDPQAVALL
ncbi:ABC transporter ATP-binding protein [Cellulomonas chengniuliangii]|uniref:ABC transporter ATP-binding protein n=1 Tax=Cellulomonas chengniuliangii TaxID=2968084 RepID=UPI001D0EBB9E|nr:ABC transporter ATP-binding protein [Cellulomonas chengniuliangii]MCC2316549.1 ABC transporter ATP-binding protein [Cellulomonas chengniuliangii]